MSTRQAYPTDLTDAQWAIIEPLLPAAAATGRPRTIDLREVLNAIFYLNRAGCQWDMLPHDLPSKTTVFRYFAKWQKDGTWQRMVDALRPQVREAAGRDPNPKVASIDSQTVKGTEIGGQRGYDGGKKIRGVKRHIIVDSLGLLMVVVVSAANADDGTFASKVLRELTLDHRKRLEVVYGDGKYNNRRLDRFLGQGKITYRLEVINRPFGSKGFVKLPKRWVVERSFAWLGRYRRNSRDYEWGQESSESMIRISSIHQMLRRLSPDKSKRVASFKYPKPSRTTGKVAV